MNGNFHFRGWVKVLKGNFQSFFFCFEGVPKRGGVGDVSPDTVNLLVSRVELEPAGVGTRLIVSRQHRIEGLLVPRHCDITSEVFTEFGCVLETLPCPEALYLHFVFPLEADVRLVHLNDVQSLCLHYSITPVNDISPKSCRQ